jgi:hypothetical protein
MIGVSTWHNSRSRREKFDPNQQKKCGVVISTEVVYRKSFLAFAEHSEGREAL